MSLVEDRRHFDRVAGAYDRGRPPYPARVYELLAERGLLGAGVRLLDVGAGSGQATAELLDRGAAVDAVEPGAGLAALLRERFAGRGLRVLEGDVEDVPLAEGSYDGAVAATSLHWVDLARTLPRLHAALRPGGWLVAWWTVFGDPEVATPFRERVDAIAAGAGLSRQGIPAPLAYDDRLAELAGGGLFEPEPPEVVGWSTTLDTAGVRDLFTTFPAWAAVPELVDRVADAADACGGRVEERYLTVVYPARRADHPPAAHRLSPGAAGSRR